MKISSTFQAMSYNSIINANRMGQGVGKNAQGVFGLGLPFQKNRLDFSPYGTSSGIVDALNKQKMSIENWKSELILSAKERGLSQESIQARLDSYDEQIKKIDEQITEATIQQMMTAAEQQKNVVKKNDSEPKTEQEIQNEKMKNLMSLSSGLDKVSIMSSVKTRVDGSSRVLETEIELDKARAGSSPGSAESIAKKEEELAALQQQSRSLNVEIGKQLTDLNEQIQENNKPIDKVEEPEKDENDATGNENVENAADTDNRNDDTNVEDSEETSTSRPGAFQPMIERYVQMAQLSKTDAVEVSQVDALA